MRNQDFDDFEEKEEVYVKDKSKRANRRHHLKRMKSKVKRIYKDLHMFNNEEDLENFSVKNANHMKNCSCSMCGNPRHHLKGKEKKTKKEIVFEEKMREQIEDMGDCD